MTFSTLRPLFRPRNLLSSGYNILLGCCLVVTVTDHFVDIIPVMGESMSPSLSPFSKSAGKHDYVFLSRLNPTKDLKRGDVITFWKPHKPEEISIKRVIALEGDEVWPRDREKGTHGGYGGYGERENFKGGRKIKIPHGHVWVEGDHWRGSYDSNDLGPISKSLIDGKAIGIVRWGRIEDIPQRTVKGGTTVIPGVSQLPKEWVEG